MPSKKTPLFCLVLGDPEISAFAINYTKNTTVDELRKTIYNKKNSLTNNDYPDLTLYLVLIPTRNVEAIFTTAPAVDHIHIIVEISDATKRGSVDEEMRNDIKEMKKDIKDMKKEKSEVNISSVNYKSWERIQAYLGLEYENTKQQQVLK
ncbi:37951_t:CDS:2 [Gigaspora margarita]|uniref:37951_t:CDS:1 n=1 Tax=Gigaspora margarita TaxID=4874 RepID=A0ABN7XE01_GIGMA|nr:37951_t:CDS:2 [Gigaspora margarita]